MSFTNYYVLLEVSEDATTADIKRAFRKQAFKHHPDRNGGSASSEALFKEINRAYQVLSDPHERYLYDAQLTASRSIQPDATPYYTGSNYQRHNQYSQPTDNPHPNTVSNSGGLFLLVLFFLFLAGAMRLTHKPQIIHTYPANRGYYIETKHNDFVPVGNGQPAFVFHDTVDTWSR